MHPDDAKERSLVAGDNVLLSNATGQRQLIVKTENTIPRTVVVVPTSLFLLLTLYSLGRIYFLCRL